MVGGIMARARVKSVNRASKWNGIGHFGMSTRRSGKPPRAQWPQLAALGPPIDHPRCPNPMPAPTHRASLQSTKETTLPTGPPTFRRAEAALEIAGPAAAVALDRPSEAFEAAEEAVWPALLAASEVEEACLTTVLRVRNCDCRSTARVAAGMLGTAREGEGAKMRIQAQITRGSRWFEGRGGPMADLVLAQRRTRICGSRFGNFREGRSRDGVGI